MTPKEKANEIVTKIQLDWGCNCCHNDWAKECALILCDELLCNSTFLISTGEAYFWNEVKKEIELL